MRLIKSKSKRYGRRFDLENLEFRMKKPIQNARKSVLITIPLDVLKELDSNCKILKLTRTKLIQHAVEQYLEEWSEVRKEGKS